MDAAGAVNDLFPAPRQILSLDEAQRATGDVAVRTDPALRPQAYELSVDDDGVRLSVSDEAGRRYGEQTVRQLRGPDGSLPHVRLRDWPDFTARGFMLDVSRSRVPTRATLARLVEILATCRYNQLQLYIEHAFAYVGHEEVWRDASPITPVDLEWLDGLCAEAGIELVGNQNCFGHFGPWLSHETYRTRAECPDGFEVVPGVRFPPTVLAPTADNARFAVALVREQLRCLTSRTVNVGCDETFELGRGASRSRAQHTGTASVYTEHLRRIVDPLLADGLAVQFWGDVIAKHPEQLASLPADGLTALVWNYEAPGAPPFPLGGGLERVLDEIGIDLNADTHFAPRLAPFAKSGVPFWVAPGTSSWNSLVGRLDSALANLADAAEAGLAAGANGFLVTDWGDNGHHQPPSVSFPPIAYGGAVGWCAAANRGLDVVAAVNRHLLADATGHAGAALDALGRVASRTGMIGRNSSPLAAALFPNQFHAIAGEPDPEAVREVVDTLDRAVADLARAEPSCVDAGTVLEELAVAARLARAGARALAARAGDDATAGTARARHAELTELVEQYRGTWLSRSHPGGLTASVAHFDAAFARLDEDR